jgi:hypothetical protein
LTLTFFLSVYYAKPDPHRDNSACPDIQEEGGRVHGFPEEVQHPGQAVNRDRKEDTKKIKRKMCMVHCSTYCRVYVHSGADAMYVFLLLSKSVPGPKCQRIHSSLFPRTSLTPPSHIHPCGKNYGMN